MFPWLIIFHTVTVFMTKHIDDTIMQLEQQALKNIPSPYSLIVGPRNKNQKTPDTVYHFDLSKIGAKVNIFCSNERSKEVSAKKRKDKKIEKLQEKAENGKGYVFIFITDNCNFNKLTTKMSLFLDRRKNMPFPQTASIFLG